ncbi:MAG TPA: MFS transporter [Ramlibacter sp.]|nr:MFS transporter [Ramlibacter sp.]
MTDDNSSRKLWADLAPILVGHVCLHAVLTGARMAAPLLALESGHGAAGAGVLVALFAATQIFLSLPAGRFADRHGLKRPAAMSVVAAACGAGMAALWPVYLALCVAALLVGGAVGAATIALQRHAGRLAQSPSELKQAFSWLAIAPAVSALVGPLSVGFMIDHGGYRAAFALLAAFPLLAWLLLRRAREVIDEEAPVASGGTAWELLKAGPMRRLMVMNWVMIGAWDLHGFMVPVLGHERGLSASAIGAILAAFAIASAFIRLLLPVLARRIREWALITGALGISGMVFLAYPFTRNAVLMGLCSALLGMALGMVQPMIMSMLHQITPRHRQGEALGVRLVLINLSSAGMPLLFGAVGGVIGSGGVFWAMGLIVALGSRLGFRLRDDASGADPH